MNKQEVGRYLRGHYGEPKKDAIKLNFDQDMFLTSKDAGDAIALYWRGDPEIRRTHRVGQWIMETFFPGTVNEKLYNERCHMCAAQMIMKELVEEMD